VLCRCRWRARCGVATEDRRECQAGGHHQERDQWHEPAQRTFQHRSSFLFLRATARAPTPSSTPLNIHPALLPPCHRPYLQRLRGRTVPARGVAIVESGDGCRSSPVCRRARMSSPTRCDRWPAPLQVGFPFIFVREMYRYFPFQEKIV
jgi:hypothetical protein